MDKYVELAKKTIELYVEEGNIYNPLPDDLEEEMKEKRAGVFVSIHKNGQLRGCIGTIAPTRESIAKEIVQNAISASTKDPRFIAIEPEELKDLEINVDVLSESEQINSEAELDVKRYGVIVEKGYKRGLLLPNLDGVDTISEQVSIAKMKAGIGVDDMDVTLYRFEVVRHI